MMLLQMTEINANIPVETAMNGQVNHFSGVLPLRICRGIPDKLQLLSLANHHLPHTKR